MAHKRFTTDDLISLATANGWALNTNLGVRRLVLAGRVQNAGDKLVSIWDDGEIQIASDMFDRKRTPRQAAAYLGLVIDD